MEDKKFGHPGFYKLLDEMAELHSRKNHDYAGTSDPLKNLRRSQSIGIDPFTGVMIRLQDKWSRLEQFMQSGIMQVSNESVEDTLIDNAVYSLLAIILKREAASQTPVVGLSLPPAPCSPPSFDSVVENMYTVKALRKSSYTPQEQYDIITNILSVPVEKRDPNFLTSGLISMFVWSNTPQGSEYWGNIADRLVEEHCYA